MSRKQCVSRKLLSCVALGALSLGLTATRPAPAKADDDGTVRHVLLISIDGMHALDFINCANGIAGANGGAPYCPNLAGLKPTGVDYLDASTSKPSDSFPGLMALVSGGSPRSVGAFYDVAYDRSLDPPATTTENGVAGSPGACSSGSAPTGTATEFDEGIDLDKTKLNGGAPTGDGGINSIDPKKLDAIRPAVAHRFIRGTSCGPIRSSAWCTRPEVIPLGPTSIRRTLRFPVRATVAISMTITRPRSIQSRSRCRAYA